MHENDWIRPDAPSLVEEQLFIQDVVVFEHQQTQNLPNFQVERVMHPSQVPGLPPREIIHITPTSDPPTQEGRLYQQKIAEEILIHQRIWGINGTNEGT